MMLEYYLDNKWRCFTLPIVAKLQSTLSLDLAGEIVEDEALTKTLLTSTGDLKTPEFIEGDTVKISNTSVTVVGISEGNNL